VVGSVSDPTSLAWGNLKATSLNATQQGRHVVAFDRHWTNDDTATTLKEQPILPVRYWQHPHQTPPELASTVELAVLVSRASRCPERLQQCIEAFPHLQAVNVVSGGFRERNKQKNNNNHKNSGGEENNKNNGLALEQTLLDMAHDANIRLLGPNSIGVIDSYSKFASMFLRTFPPPGHLSLISQSGGVCGALVELLYENQIMGMSKVLSLGNKADIGFCDGLEAVAEDPYTKVILLYMEGLGQTDDPAKFIDLARTVAKDKPIVALKAGASAAGVRAVSSHTGSLAGNRAIFAAALREAGILQTDSLQEMLEMAQALSCRTRVPLVSVPSKSWDDDNPKYRVGILTNAGGPAALSTDALSSTEATTIPLLSETLQHSIRAADRHHTIHPLADTCNPVDLLGGGSPTSYQSALGSLLTSSEVDAVVALHVPTVHTHPEEFAQAIIAGAQSHPHKTVVGMMVSNDHTFLQPAVSLMNQADIPTFCHAQAAGNAFRAWKEREFLLRLQQEDDVENTNPSVQLSAAHIQKVRDYLQTIIHHLERPDGWVLEHDARPLLDLIGIEQPKAKVVPFGSSAEDVLAAAERIGYPVVLKRQDRVHKSDQGGVQLHLKNASEVRAALEQMFPSSDDLSSLGAPVLVCEYVSTASSAVGGSVREFLVGATRDEIFGPAVCFGTGGVLVEAIGDVAFALPPKNRQATLDLLRRTKLASRRLQGGIRSEPPVDASMVADAVERISCLVQNVPEIAEIDINPLMVGLSADNETRAVAADIKFKLERIE
jgi:acyl-CoA synthetase (NDP forming)